VYSVTYQIITETSSYHTVIKTEDAFQRWIQVEIIGFEGLYFGCGQGDVSRLLILVAVLDMLLPALKDCDKKVDFACASHFF